MAKPNYELQVMSEPVLHLEFLEKSRKTPIVGDVFCLKLLRDQFHFGRVISTTANVGEIPGLILIYIYRITSSQSLETPELDCSNLLIPPVITNRQGWYRGYFKTLKHEELLEKDKLKVHCFFSPIKNKYYDDNNVELSAKSDPCGFHGVDSYASIDFDMCKALGLDPDKPIT